MLTVAVGMLAGFTISFPEAADTARADMRQIGPHVMFGPPRIWESMVSDVQVRLAEADWLKRATFTWGHRLGDREARRREHGERSPWYERALLAVADLVALRPVREQLGLSRLQRAYTGGAPLGPDVFRFFQSLRINLKQIYGQTEICGIAVAHVDGDVRFHTVGRPTPGTELRIADDGEILLRSRAVLQGYLNNPGATAEAVDADGWLHTGDAGYLDDGHLVVIDRAKDVRRAAGGDLFSPAFIENKLKFSPFVEEAVVFGGEDDVGITAILTIDGQTVGTWAERHHLSYTTYTDLSQKPEVRELLAEEVFRANEDLPESIRVLRFVVLHKPLDADDDEITRTRKVRRDVIGDRYRDIVTALEEDAPAVTIHTTVMYQDGTRAERELELAVRSLHGFVPAGRRRRGLTWSGA
jgi:long-chain acyl-CoA synthetase